MGQADLREAAAARRPRWRLVPWALLLGLGAYYSLVGLWLFGITVVRVYQVWVAVHGARLTPQVRAVDPSLRMGGIARSFFARLDHRRERPILMDVSPALEPRFPRPGK
jgi:hypothetical protein